jgi:acyl dehydratase
MPIDMDVLGAESSPAEVSWTSKDSLIYALGVGAGVAEPAFTTENTTGVAQQALPTMAVVLGAGAAELLARAGDFDRRGLVHGEERVDVHEPLPVEGTVCSSSQVTAIYDKGSGAVLEITTTATDRDTGQPLFSTVMPLFVRGAGGFGGERGPSGSRNRPPDRAPDEVVRDRTRDDQALLYRLSGDRNPLHSDHAVAARAGFDRPILHGLCTFGFAGRALVNAVCDGDASRVRMIEGRFSAPVFPGEALSTAIWRDGPGAAVFETSGGDGRVVVAGGRARVVP